jgi:hypothetical protein
MSPGLVSCVSAICNVTGAGNFQVTCTQPHSDLLKVQIRGAPGLPGRGLTLIPARPVPPLRIGPGLRVHRAGPHACTNNGGPAHYLLLTASP